MNARLASSPLRANGAVLVLLLVMASLAHAQQPPFEGAVSPEPLEPRESLAQPDLDGAEYVIFGIHRMAALALAPIVELGVESGFLGTGTGSIEGFQFSPGGVGPNSGIGGSAGYVIFPDPLWAGVEVGATVKGYQQHTVFVGARTERGDRYVRAAFQYDLDTEDEFSGLGMDSPEFRDEDEEIDAFTDYRQEEIRLLGDAQISFAENFRLGARGGWRKNNLRGGENDDVEDTQVFFADSLFDELPLPGVSGEEGEYGTGGLFASFDTRNGSGNPDRGVLLGLSFDAFRGLSDTPFDWDRYAGEFAGYLPLPDETSVFATRVMVIHQDPQEEQSLVPFYFLSGLGGGNVLRSYSSFRFQDNDAVYGVVEFRKRVWAEDQGLAAIDAALFAESGGVYRDITEDLELGDMEQSYGTELRLLVPNDVVWRTGVAVGDEGVKFYVSGGGRF